MKYSKAEKVLPDELLSEVQKYVQGELLYIPVKDEQRKGWGSSTQSKKHTESRNVEIRDAFKRGRNVRQLSEEYFLSHDSIKKIVYGKY